MPPVKSHGIRAVIRKVRSGKIQRVDTTGRFGESHTDREMFQQYGYVSRPFELAEGIMMFLGGDVNNAVVIATEDRRYRLAIEEGEVALYDDQGSKVHLKRGGIVEVTAPVKIVNKAPLIEFYGLIQSYDYEGGEAGTATIHGNVYATGLVSDGVRAMSADRTIYNGHTHPPGNNTPMPQE